MKAIAVLACVALASFGYADVTWDGNGNPNASGNWSDPLNWDSDALPGESDIVVLPTVTAGTRSITVDAAVTVAGLRVEQNNQTAYNDVSLAADLTVGSIQLSGEGAAYPKRFVRMQLNGRTFTFSDLISQLEIPVPQGTGTVVKKCPKLWNPHGPSGNNTWVSEFTGLLVVENRTIGYNQCNYSTFDTRIMRGATCEFQNFYLFPSKSYTIDGQDGNGFNNQGHLYCSGTFAMASPITLLDNPPDPENPVPTFCVIKVNPGQTFTVNGGISGAGGIKKTGTGTLVLGNTLTYSGDTLVTAGTLETTSVLQNSAVFVSADATLRGPASLFPMGVTLEEGANWDQNLNLWTGNGDSNNDGDWSAGANWLAGIPPTDADVAILPTVTGNGGSGTNVRTITVDADATVATLRVTQESVSFLNDITLGANLNIGTFEVLGTAANNYWDSKVRIDTTGYTVTWDKWVGYRFRLLGTGTAVNRDPAFGSAGSPYGVFSAFNGTFVMEKGFLNNDHARFSGMPLIEVKDMGCVQLAPHAGGFQPPQACKLNGNSGAGAPGYAAHAYCDGSIDLSIPFTIASDSTIKVQPSQTLTLSGPVDGVGGIRKTGTGRLMLTGDLTYSGDTYVVQGTLEVVSIMQNSHVILEPGATLIGPESLFPQGVTDNGGIWDPNVTSWTGNGDPDATGDWSDGTNWLGLAAPSEADTVVLPTVSIPRLIMVDIPATINRLRATQITAVNNDIQLAADMTVGTIEVLGDATNSNWDSKFRIFTADWEGNPHTFTFDAWIGNRFRFLGNGTVVKRDPAYWVPYGITSDFAGMLVIDKGMLSNDHGRFSKCDITVNEQGGAQLAQHAGVLQEAKSYTLDGNGGTGPAGYNCHVWCDTSFTTNKPFTILSQSTIKVEAGQTLTLTGPVDGVGGIRKTGLGKLIIAGTPLTFSGETAVLQGTLEVMSVFENSPVVIEAGGTLIGPASLFPQGVINNGGTWDPNVTVWTGNGDVNNSGTWSDGQNWLGLVQPAEIDTVTLPSVIAARVVDVDVPASVVKLRMVQDTLAINNDVLLNADLSVGALEIMGAATNDIWNSKCRIDTNGSTFTYDQHIGNQLKFLGAGTVVKRDPADEPRYGTFQNFQGTLILEKGILSNDHGRYSGFDTIVKAKGTVILAQHAGGLNACKSYTLDGNGDLGAPGYLAHLYCDASYSYAGPITVQTQSQVKVTSGQTLTLSGEIDGSALMAKDGPGVLALSGTCATDLRVTGGPLAIEGSAVVDDASAIYLTTGASIDVADGQNDTIGALYFNGVPQAPGTWGRSGSGADHVDDAFFSSRLGVLTVGAPLPTVTQFSVTDQTTGSGLFTNSPDVNVVLSTEAAAGEITGWLVAESPDQPTGGWLAAAPAVFTITSGEGTVSLHAWVQDSSGGVGHATATILFSTATPAVSNVVVTDNGDGTATATWTTDVLAEGSAKYGPVTLAGATPNTASENALGSAHSVSLTITTGTNYKIVLVNNESASSAVYWPSPWPIEGDANMDCRVNILDLIFIRNKLNLAVETGDNWKADVNNDTRINILDLIYVRNKLNTQCP